MLLLLLGVVSEGLLASCSKSNSSSCTCSAHQTLQQMLLVHRVEQLQAGIWLQQSDSGQLQLTL
jgi:hypothetical protein